MSSLESYLEGFEFIESDYLPFISLDKHGRFHVNKNARRLLGVKPYDVVVLAYHGKNNELAVIPSKNTDELEKAAFAKYTIDKRCYMSAKALAKEFNLLGEHRVFYYDRSTPGETAFIFKMKEQ